MLVLSRKQGERIFVGDLIKITVVRIGPGTVRVGIEAPRDMDIVREELTFDLSPDQADLLEAAGSVA
jgi:carbon storage regulator